MAAPVSTQTTPEARVLVVDDETNIVELLSVSLKFQGFEVYTAANGPAALDRAREIKPDAVILDVMMPGLDGYEVARRIRARTDPRRLRLIALTGFGQEDDRHRALEAGFDAHLVKPIDFEQLARIVAQARD